MEGVVKTTFEGANKPSMCLVKLEDNKELTFRGYGVLGRAKGGVSLPLERQFRILTLRWKDPMCRARTDWGVNSIPTIIRFTDVSHPFRTSDDRARKRVDWSRTRFSIPTSLKLSSRASEQHMHRHDIRRYVMAKGIWLVVLQ